MATPDILGRCNWASRGYFAYPLCGADDRLPDLTQWREIAALVAAAKGGDFSGLPPLVDRVAYATGWMRRGELAQLLGDAGSSRSLSQLRAIAQAEDDIILSFVYSEVLEFWGHLSAIPVLVDIYERFSFSEDAMYVASGLSSLLERTRGDVYHYPMDGGEDDQRRYCALLRDRYAALCDRLGTDDAIVFRGDIVEVRNIAGVMLEDLRGKTFEHCMRHKFEAYTGIDCSGFYKAQQIQPLTAASIIEEFLNSPAVDRFEPGVRYFFGHRLS